MAGIGLRCLGHRFYDPAVGRFLSPDPIGFGGGLNLYAYCDNDPVNCADPSGLAADPDTDPDPDPDFQGDRTDPADVLIARLRYAQRQADLAEQARQREVEREVEQGFHDILARHGIDPADFKAEEIAALGRIMAGGDHPTPIIVPCSALRAGLLPPWIAGEGEEAGAPPVGPYDGLKAPRSIGAGFKVTPMQKRLMFGENERRNGGRLLADDTGEPLVRSGKSQEGVTPPANEAQVDHRKNPSCCSVAEAPAFRRGEEATHQLTH